jgi:hypothetical protein
MVCNDECNDLKIGEGKENVVVYKIPINRDN